ncbi:DUF721 domain-containing protein [Vibrio maerlii]|uniref:DUF721 domain-containing protein n=1 Tax=Vibrio maerlii TaxID=2231648 RepID=UPI000E3CE074|nr:DciA family protein [Vibrio maerlii]
MRDHRPTLTQDLIEGTNFGQLQQHAKEILAINQTLTTILPNSVAAHCRAANLSGGNLTIEVSAASIKMKIDYDRLNILSQLRMKGYPRLISLEVKINPSLYQSYEKEEKKKKKRPPISQPAADALMTLSDIATPKIRERLERIAQLANKRSE